MISSITDDQETIRRMVRGEISWTELKAIGITISINGDRCKIENQRGLVAKANAQDLAKGFVTYLNNPAELRRWAYVLEAGSTFLDLDMDNDPDGEKLLQALWKESFGA